MLIEFRILGYATLLFSCPILQAQSVMVLQPSPNSISLLQSLLESQEKQSVGPFMVNGKGYNAGC